ncbi:hypothetical protein [Comamonas sp. C24C]
MSQSKHSAGPWDLRTQLNCIDEYDCYLYPMRIFIPEDVSEADALLIAAAPELLEALKSLRSAYERLKPPGYPKADVEKIAEAAIVKATGEPHE